MEKVKIEIVDGPGGYSLYVNDTRIAGPKPLGGGRLVRAFAVDEQALIDSLPALRELVEKATGTCVWVHESGWYPHVYHTSCGKIESEEFIDQRPFCPFCGKQIEVKDGN